MDDLIPEGGIGDVANLDATPLAPSSISRHALGMLTQANIDRSIHSTPVSGMLIRQRSQDNIQSSHPRPVLLINLFVYVRMKTKRGSDNEIAARVWIDKIRSNAQRRTKPRRMS